MNPAHAALTIASGFSVPLDFVTQPCGIIARRGAGKTHTGVVLAEELLSAGAQVVVKAYPRAISVEDIAASTLSQYEPNGGGFRNALGRLRTLGLITGRGELRATAELMGDE